MPDIDFGERKIGTALVLSLVMALLAATTVEAGDYVSWQGGFRMSIPDDFRQVDYRVVDSVLVVNRAQPEVFDYDAVFADSASDPFTAGEYFIVTVDSTGELTTNEREAALDELGENFGRQVGYYPFTEFVTNLSTNFPTYDRDLKMASVVAGVAQPDGTVKRNLMLMRFYEGGTATFFYYAPDSIFEAGIDRMRAIVASMSTDNLDSAVTHEKPAIADIKPSQKAEEPADEDDDSTSIVPFIGLAVVVVVLLAVRLGKRRKK